MTLKFPENATPDASFQQKTYVLRMANGVRSDLRPEDIPKGVLVIPSDKEDKIYDPGWAVSNPQLKAIERDESGKVTRYQVGMRLCCSVGSDGANPHFAEC